MRQREELKQTTQIPTQSPERKINNGFGNKKCMRRFIFDSWSVYDTENHGRFRSRIFLNSVKISKS